jgi:phage FluMu protein gp41
MCKPGVDCVDMRAAYMTAATVMLGPDLLLYCLNLSGSVNGPLAMEQRQ